MAETRTRPTGESVAAFLGGVEPAGRREDAARVDAMLRRVSGEEPCMWGPSIVGYGSYHYRYGSGHGGDAPRIGFSPRKGATVLYLSDEYPRYRELMDRLGKHMTGKACLYVKKLADVDMAVLEELAAESWAHMAAKYPG